MRVDYRNASANAEDLMLRAEANKGKPVKGPDEGANYSMYVFAALIIAVLAVVAVRMKKPSAPKRIRPQQSRQEMGDELAALEKDGIDELG